jgi:hypothetical protein
VYRVPEGVSVHNVIHCAIPGLSSAMVCGLLWAHCGVSAILTSDPAEVHSDPLATYLGVTIPGALAYYDL